MNKPIIIFLGLIAGLISVLFLDELLKMLTAVILIKDHAGLTFSGFKLNIILPVPGTNNFFSYAAVLITPLIGSILFIETSLIWLTKTISDRARSFIIIFQLINIGYLIFTIFIIILSILLKSSFTTDWQLLLNYSSLSYSQGLIFIMLMAFILLAYINILTKRLKKSIPVIGRK